MSDFGPGPDSGPDPGGSAIVLVAVAVVVVIGSAFAVSGAIAADGEPTVDRPGSVVSVLQDDEDEDDENESAHVRHQNPDAYAEDGNPEELERWLSDWMIEQLDEGAIELRQGEYDDASQHVDEEYYDRLEQYVEVTDEIDGESQEELFEAAGGHQEGMTDAVREYEELTAEYEAARDAGDEQRARELARELDELADEIGDSSATVRQHYAELETEAEANLSESSAALEAVNEDVQETQAEIREEQFVETRLTIETERGGETETETETETISFLEPLDATGRLETVDGDPVANEDIALEIGNQTIPAETDGSGAFEFTYRPIAVPVETTDLEIRYDPENHSAYLGTETTVPVSIEQVEPSVTDLEVTEEMAYGDEVAVSGEIAVDDVPVEVLVLAVTLDGEQIGTVDVSDGTFDGTAEVPLTVGDGERELGVSWPFEEWALAAVSETDSVTVLETDSRLSVDAERVGDDEVRINGTLATADGDAVANQSVHLSIGGTTVETVSSGENGAFEATVARPGSGGGDVQVRAVYDDSETSLASARAESTVSFPQADTGPMAYLPAIAVAVLGALAFLGAALGYRRYRERRDSRRPVETALNEAADEDRDGERPRIARLSLSRAEEQLSSGHPNAAMESCYAAARHELASRIGASDVGGATHWEFYRTYLEAVDGIDRDANTDELLREVTERYERAAFDATSIAETEVEATLERVRELVETGARGEDVRELETGLAHGTEEEAVADD